jgi:hypothetical protein
VDDARAKFELGSIPVWRPPNYSLIARRSDLGGYSDVRKGAGNRVLFHRVIRRMKDCIEKTRLSRSDYCKRKF